jgi:SAM-dependent methyltransferase
VIKDLARQCTPPCVWNALSLTKERVAGWRPQPDFIKNQGDGPPEEQALDVYWTPEMAHSLEVWGIGTTWDEIEYLLVNQSGKVLDIACGTGKNIELLGRFPSLEIHGCDISDMLIKKAHERGVPEAHAIVADATKLPYEDGTFDYSYSIGSLEHFTLEGIDQFVQECKRVTTKASFHQMPTSRSGKDEGWMTTVQSFHNNSPDWWVDKFKKAFPRVDVLNSRWDDPISIGKWFVCHNE